MMSRLIAILAVLLALVAPSLSQTITNVQGTITHGASITITGTDFGARVASPASFFENWDWGVANTNVDTTGSPWTVDHPGGRGVVQFKNYASRGGRGFHSHSLSPDPETHSTLNKNTYRGNLDIDFGEKFYVSSFSNSTLTQPGNDCPQQWKIWYFGGGDEALGRPHAGLQWTGGGTPMFWIGHGCGSGSGSITSINWGQLPQPNQWWQFEAQLKAASGQYADDGSMKVWFNGFLAGALNNVVYWCDDTWEVNPNEHCYNVATLRHYIPTPDCPGTEFILRHDDIVVQVGTWARVHLGDASTWTACTVHEYQPVTNWSNNQITVTVNQGGFNNGQSAWLYVVRDDGTVSAGRAVSFTGNDSGPPGPPSTPFWLE